MKNIIDFSSARETLEEIIDTIKLQIKSLKKNLTDDHSPEVKLSSAMLILNFVKDSKAVRHLEFNILFYA